MCWEQSKRQAKEERRASSSPGRKEGFPLASDCLTCKNVAFVAGLRSGFWQAVCDQLSPFPFSLFLCRFACLPFKPGFFGFCHNANWKAQNSSQCPLVFYSSPIFSHKFQGPKAVGEVRTKSGKKSKHEQPWVKSVCPHVSYEGVLASNRPTTLELVPFSCLGEEQPGVGPLYGEEPLLLGRDSVRGRGVSEGVVRGSRSRSGGRRMAGEKGNARGKPVM